MGFIAIVQFLALNGVPLHQCEVNIIKSHISPEIDGVIVQYDLLLPSLSTNGISSFPTNFSRQRRNTISRQRR